MRAFLLFSICSIVVLQSCKTRQLSQNQSLAKELISDNERLFNLMSKFENDNQVFTGLIITDAESGQTLFSHHEDKFFTPASNTKLFTLLAAQHYLSDSIPALRYAAQGDSLIIRGTGDPTFLTKNDIDSVAFHFLQQREETIYLDQSHMTAGRFGSGWSWDDYAYYYQKENSSFPIAGQATRIKSDPDSSDFMITPEYLKQFITKDITQSHFLSREEHTNRITINPVHQPTYAREYEVPFYQDSSVTVGLLSHLLQKEVNQLEGSDDFLFETLYHQNSDSLYKELMLVSDNFVAEQLLFLIGSELDMELNTRKIIRKLLSEPAFAGIPDRPRWVDGSGLSRYNLMTPRSMIWVLERLDSHLTESEIKDWFPSGEHLGTLPKELEHLNLSAKTGTLSNNFCLSGYLVTESGKRLHFSWMNNHFMVPKSKLAGEMAALLSFVQERF